MLEVTLKEERVTLVEKVKSEDKVLSILEVMAKVGLWVLSMLAPMVVLSAMLMLVEVTSMEVLSVLSMLIPGIKITITQEIPLEMLLTQDKIKAVRWNTVNL